LLLSTVLGLLVKMRDLGIVLTAPFELLLPPGTSRESDFLYLSREIDHGLPVRRL
jgi:hypothetical protein